MYTKLNFAILRVSFLRLIRSFNASISAVALSSTTAEMCFTFFACFWLLFFKAQRIQGITYASYDVIVAILVMRAARVNVVFVAYIVLRSMKKNDAAMILVPAESLFRHVNYTD